MTLVNVIKPADTIFVVYRETTTHCSREQKRSVIKCIRLILFMKPLNHLLLMYEKNKVGKWKSLYDNLICKINDNSRNHSIIQTLNTCGYHLESMNIFNLEKDSFQNVFIRHWFLLTLTLCHSISGENAHTKN